MLQRFNPPYDATVVSLLKRAGASIVGKTNCDEFGMGSANKFSHHGPVINPHPFQDASKEAWRLREQRSAGGSSGGSAAAVAMDLCDVALGTDTGGSIRLPAAYCGVMGYKPSYGLISRWGVVAFADSLDCVGILARDTRRISQTLDILAVHDPKDPTCLTDDLRAKLPREESTAQPLQGIRIGIPQEYFPVELDSSITSRFRNTVRLLAKSGAEILFVSLPSTPYALSAYYVISSAEASSNLARFDGVQFGEYTKPEKSFRGIIGDLYALNRSKHFGPEVKRRILLGTYALTAAAFDNYYLRAQQLRKLVRDDFDRVFTNLNMLRENKSTTSPVSSPTVDFLLHPSAIQSAPPLHETNEEDSLNSYVQDILTVPASLAGLPAISLPVGNGQDGWPLGVSLVGQWGTDRRLLEVAGAIEELI